jgi:D-alanine-D-alanine ligase
MIVILKGGRSAEREVSLLTAKSIAESLSRQKISFQEIDAADNDWLEKVKRLKPEIVVIALHGTFGEDGGIQDILEKNNIHFTGSNSKSSALAFDKIETKLAVKNGLKILVPRNFSQNKITTYPVVIKPNKQGSSFGISIVHKQSELKPAIALAQKYAENDAIIVEEYIKGTELTCGVIDVFGETIALPLVEIAPKNTFFDYDSKYNTESGCEEICPAHISKKISLEIQEKSKQVHQLLGLKQYSRTDWILRGQEQYFLETNTLPGMTPTSLLPKELAAANIRYDEFINKLVNPT